MERFMGRQLCIETEALYFNACPSKHLPFSAPSLLVAGGKDVDVPEDMIELFYNTHSLEDENMQVSTCHFLTFQHL